MEYYRKRRKEVLLEPEDYYYDYEYPVESLKLENIYIYNIEFNKKTNQYEIVTEVWQNPVGYEKIRFSSGESLWIDQGPVRFVDEATWAVRREMSTAEIISFFKPRLKKLIDEKCDELQKEYEANLAKTKSYYNAPVVKITKRND